MIPKPQNVFKSSYFVDNKNNPPYLSHGEDICQNVASTAVYGPGKPLLGQRFGISLEFRTFQNLCQYRQSEAFGTLLRKSFITTLCGYKSIILYKELKKSDEIKYLYCHFQLQFMIYLALILTKLV